MTNLIDPLTTVMYNYVLCVLLVGAGLWFTIRSRGLQFRFFTRMLKVVTQPSTDSAGGISSF